MNNANISKTLLAALIAGATIGAAYAESCPMPAGQPQHTARPVVQGAKGVMPQASKGVQKVTVTVDGGFKPSTISVKAGKPVQITFAVKRPGCANKVVFPAQNITKSLKAGQKTVVTITPKKAGTINFACGMGMYKGRIVAR